MIVRRDFRADTVREKGTEGGDINLGFRIYSLMFLLILSVWAEEALFTYFPRDVGT